MAREYREEKPSNMVASVGFSYSDVSSNNPTIQTHLANQMQSFVSNPELFNLTTGMEMLGFPSKNLHDQRDINSAMWKGFFGKPGNQESSSSRTMNEPTNGFYHHEFSKPDFSTGFSETKSENLIVAPNSAWQDNRFLVEDSSQSCVFPCEGNERPSQGLSLSLCSNKPSSIRLQSFELRETSHQHQQQDDIRYISSNSRDGFFGKSANLHHQQQQTLQDGFSGKAVNLHQTFFQLKNSKYLVPAQELLNELCNLEAKQTDLSKQKPHKINQRDDENGGGSSRNQSLYSLELHELQTRKTKLLSMLENVDRRHRHYCDQMKAVVASFEAEAGTGAAMVYSALASKAMSRHFRCLRDGIVGQIQATKKVLGEKDPVTLGTTKGETPRLRLIDRTLRQQKAFLQINMMESHPWRPQRGLPEQAVSVLRAWLFEHFLHPYPNDVDKHILARQTGLSRSQVSNWFINARVRLWKPMVEEMYIEETKEQDNIASSDGVTGLDDNVRPPNQNHPTTPSENQKPTSDQLVRVESECLSYIISNPEKTNVKNTRNPQYHHHHQQELQQHQHQFGRITDTNGVIDLDFSSYNHHPASNLSYTNESVHQNFGSGVSLTLGLQQQGGSGVSLAFPPALQHSPFFPRDHIEDCQPVQYSFLDGEAQNLPYRNLMEAQLLHDFTG